MILKVRFVDEGEGTILTLECFFLQMKGLDVTPQILLVRVALVAGTAVETIRFR